MRDDCEMLRGALERETAVFYGRDAPLPDRLRRYAEPGGLLERELDYLQRCGAARLNAESAGAVRSREPVAMAFTVGTSFEPILIAAALARPNWILLVPSLAYRPPGGEKIDGQAYGEDLAQALRAVASRVGDAAGSGPWAPEVECRPCVDSPSDVFETLRTAFLPRLRRSRWSNNAAVEITGAKKSMSAGAFLFAAFARIPIRYLDFDRYDPLRGAPLTYSCKVQELGNPAELFAVDRWWRARDLVHAWNFDAAAVELRRWHRALRAAGRGFPSTGEEAREGGPIFPRPERRRIQRLTRLLRAYAAWQNGQFHTARGCLDSLEAELAAERGSTAASRVFPRPQVLEPWFLEHWIRYPELHAPADSERGSAADAADQVAEFVGKEVVPAETRVIGDARLACAYAEDELLKLRKLFEHGRDYRSVFLRAQGLAEFLINARLGPAVTKGWVKAENGAQVTIERLAELIERGAGFAKALLAQGNNEGYSVEVPSEVHERLLPLLHRFAKLHKLRHKATHMFVSVPRRYAGAALHAARENLHEFRTSWTNRIEPAPDPDFDWQELCDACGIVFLPETAAR